MAPEVIYLLKVNIGITLFYAFYKLFCNRNTFFNCRRIALLSFLFISFLYPVLDIQDWAKEQSSMQTLAGYYATEVLPETTVFSTTATTTTRNWNILTLIRFVYIGGIIVLGLRFAIQLFSLIRLALKSRKSRLYGVSIRILTHSSGPFSFFRWIFIHPDSMQDNDIEDVLLHEQTHATQWHSIDIIISETACALCWMNPFIWLFKQEVRANLEFLADNTVVKAGYNTRDYQYHLLGLANRSSMSIPTNLSNCFNLSFLKRRVVMMNKQKSKKTDCFKYILFLPLAILLLLISNIGNIARATITATNNIIEYAEKMTSTTAHTAYKKFSFNSTIAFNPISEISATTKDSIVTPFLPDCKGEEVYNSRVYKFTKKMPQFPGGNKALMNFIKNSLVYPEEALKNNLSGRVVLDLIIGIDGSIDHINISESSNHESLDRAAIAGVKNMPKWIPGELDGDPIRVKHALPIQFRL